MGSGADMERELEERMRSRSMAAWVVALKGNGSDPLIGLKSIAPPMAGR